MIPFISCSHTKKREQRKKIMPTRENLPGSITPFLGLIQIFMLGATAPRKPLKTGAYHHRSEQKNWTWKGPISFFDRQLRDSSSMIMTKDNFLVHNHQQKTTNIVAFFSGMETNSHLKGREGNWQVNSFLILLLFFSAQTAFKGYYLPISPKSTQRTRSSSSKRVCY